MDLFNGLNPQQQQALSIGPGPVLVLAGPGSGKTRVLTQRIAYLISQLGVRPYNILAVTFTNKAARQMQARVADILGENTRGLSLGTFHATCARLLRREAQHLPFDNNFVIFDSDDQISLTKLVLRELNIDEKRYRPHSIHASISNAKNELIQPSAYPHNSYRDEIVARVYARYQEQLLASNALDFDDLLLWAVKLLEAQPEVRQQYARRYEHILVDEFQDTNLAQYTLLKYLAGFHRNLFVVGDVDQSIYRWRGADYRNVMRFESDFPDSQTILLEHNYRSTQIILDAAMAVINRNPHRVVKNLFTERGAGTKLTLKETFDGREEAAYILNTIATQVTQGAQPGDFAIMYRTNAQSRQLEEAFLHANLPYKLVGAQRFYGRREVKDVLAYLRLVHNPEDELSLARAINTPPRKIGKKTLEDLRTLASNETISLSAILIDIAQGEDSQYYGVFSSTASRALAGFGEMLAAWRSSAAELPPLALLDQILEAVDYQSYLDDGTDEGRDRWENVLEMRRLAAEYDEQGLSDFLEEVALVSDQDTLDESANVPTLMTLHAAKGLEFPQVFITGLEDGTLPHIRSFDDPEGMAEERRLFYVGITRAKDKLYLLHAANRSRYGYSEPVDPSRFLDDIPDELILGGNTLLAGRTAAGPRPDRWDSASPTASAPIIQPQYKAGMNVRHPSWGDGMVLNSKIEDAEELVDVFFEEVGLKKMIASLAKLELLEGN
ncbi:MAG: UvrD-helicase domain-containing protein [Anaerolineae bacterium]|nr:UvrD-helicase domain-containing protein [Anaerolineae bacterium]